MDPAQVGVSSGGLHANQSVGSFQEMLVELLTYFTDVLKEMKQSCNHDVKLYITPLSISNEVWNFQIRCET